MRVAHPSHSAVRLLRPVSQANTAPEYPPPPLQVFLAQLGLDKPFTGGLGSYKIYVMLGAIIDSTVRTASKYNGQGGAGATGASPSSGATPGAVRGVALGADFVLQVGYVYMYCVYKLPPTNYTTSSTPFSLTCKLCV